MAVRSSPPTMATGISTWHFSSRGGPWCTAGSYLPRSRAHTSLRKPAPRLRSGGCGKASSSCRGRGGAVGGWNAKEVNMTERPFTPKELAERWSISKQTVRDLCTAGKIPSFRVGRAFWIPADFVRGNEQLTTERRAVKKCAFLWCPACLEPNKETSVADIMEAMNQSGETLCPYCDAKVPLREHREYIEYLYALCESADEEEKTQA